jgi:hypothetical protein
MEDNTPGPIRQPILSPLLIEINQNSSDKELMVEYFSW